MSAIAQPVEIVRRPLGHPEFKLTVALPGYWTATSPLIRIFGLTLRDLLVA